MKWWPIKGRRKRDQQRNRVANPSVEAGSVAPTGWFYSANTEWVAGDAHEGHRSLRINVTAALADWRTAVYPIEGGKTYRCGLWAKGQGNAQTVLAVRWFSDLLGANWITEAWLVLDGNYGDWTYCYQDIQAPANALSGDLMWRAAFATTVAMLADDFFVRRID
ncbi:MAG: hypothetical protein KF832_12630 [Caldilineaceae bacterium]|nr:hypothetical protein [Caldilineaceae bacterium]